MKSRYLYFFLTALVIVGCTIFVPRINAQVCYPQRSISQHRCVAGTGGQYCIKWTSSYPGQNCTGVSTCTGNPPDEGTCSSTQARNRCQNNCESVYGTTFTCSTPFCNNYYFPPGSTYTCEVQTNIVNCTAAPSCQADASVANCNVAINGTSCTETTQNLVYGCWGAGPTPTPVPPPPGSTPTPTPTNTPGPTPTPTPTPYCGDTTCQIGEDPCSCPSDCGNTCPPNNGTLQVRAKIIPQGSASCADVTASSTPLTGTVFDIKKNGTSTWLGAQTQTSLLYVGWTAAEGTYTLSVDPPTGYVQQVVCPSTNPLTSLPITANSTYTVDIGFTAGTPWNRVVGGDVYAGNILRSLVSETLSAANRHFITDGAGGYPGIATYGNSYDFDPGAGLGATYVSSTGWLADDLFPVIDYYDEFYESFGGTPGTFDYTGPVTLASRPAYKADMETPFYVNGDLTIDGADWSVGNDNKMIFIIDGNLIIKNNINLTENGFIAFIVDGNISIDDSVGGQYNTTTPVIEGIYITSLGGTFDTGGSSVDGFEKLVLEGIFVANDFSLRRDLSTANPGGNQNANQASSRFVYNPMLLLEMPDAMMNSNVIWQEVAP